MNNQIKLYYINLTNPFPVRKLLLAPPFADYLQDLANADTSL